MSAAHPRSSGSAVRRCWRSIAQGWRLGQRDGLLSLSIVGRPAHSISYHLYFTHTGAIRFYKYVYSIHTQLYEYGKNTRHDNY